MTVDPNQFLGNLESAWENISYYLNKFLSAFRKRYGRCWVLRSFEAQRGGFPHIHLFVISEHTFECEWYCGGDYPRWLISAQDEPHNPLRVDEEVGGFESLWDLGYVFSRGVGSRPKTREENFNIKNYVVKDVVSDVSTASSLDDDVVEKMVAGEFDGVSESDLSLWKKMLSLSLNWLFRKQAFSISGSSVLEEVFDLIPLCLTQTEVLKSGILKRLFEFARYEFLSFCGIVRLSKPPPDGFVKLDDRDINELENKAIGVS